MTYERTPCDMKLLLPLLTNQHVCVHLILRTTYVHTPIRRQQEVGQAHRSDLTLHCNFLVLRQHRASGALAPSKRYRKKSGSPYRLTQERRRIFLFTHETQWTICIVMKISLAFCALSSGTLSFMSLSRCNSSRLQLSAHLSGRFCGEVVLFERGASPCRRMAKRKTARVKY